MKQIGFYADGADKLIVVFPLSNSPAASSTTSNPDSDSFKIAVPEVGRFRLT